MAQPLAASQQWAPISGSGVGLGRPGFDPIPRWLDGAEITRFGPWPGRRPAAAGERPRAAPAARPQGSECALVHVVEPDPELRRGLADVLCSDGFQVRTYRHLGSLLGDPLPDVAACLILDSVDFGAGDDARGARLRSEGIAAPVLVTASNPDVATAVLAMKAGAFDFIAKPCCERELLDAVSAALAADRRRRAAEARQAELILRFETLTRREREVMVLVTAGTPNRQIAATLGVSEVTVKVHRGSAMRKMGARTLADLVRLSEELEAASSSDLAAWEERNGPSRLAE